MNRRELIQALALGGTLAPGLAASETKAAAKPEAEDKTVYLVGDGIPRDPTQWMALLTRALQGRSDVTDRYLAGGAVAELEQRFATLLGKEAAVFMPTGTLANQLAVRVLCGDHRRALVQHESHLYRDENDAAQLLGGINLVPLAPGRVGPTPDEVIAAVEESLKPPYPVTVGALSLESPVRRARGAMMDLESIRAICTFARSRSIRLHLDGARLLLASYRPGFDVQAYTSLFDTVYVSLYKYLDAPAGAVLAGDKATVARARELRRVFGGNLFQAWPSALSALHALEGFPERFRKAMEAGERWIAALERESSLKVIRVDQGTNIFVLELAPERMAGLEARLGKVGIRIRPPKQNQIEIAINETILRRDTASLVRAFTGG